MRSAPCVTRASRPARPCPRWECWQSTGSGRGACSCPRPSASRWWSTRSRSTSTRSSVRLFEDEGQRLVRLVRLFVDDRNAAEDLVQEGFIRLARNAGRIRDETKAAAYLRSIVLNLARDHNRRGIVSLRHHLPCDDARASTEDEIVLQRRPAGGGRRAARPAPPPAHLPRAPLLRGAGDRRHRRDARHLPQLGEDPPPPGRWRAMEARLG